MKKLLFILAELILPIIVLPQYTINDPDTTMQDVKSNSREIGLNLLGFHINVGVKPILALNGIGGSVHAQAGTPFGQYAAAGAQGHLGIKHASGTIYARATAGEGFAAAGVGAEGVVGSQISPTGSMHAEAYNGDVFRGIILRNSDGQTLSMIQEWAQIQTPTDTNYIIRDSNKEPTSTENRHPTNKTNTVKDKNFELQPTKPHQNLSSLSGNSSIVSFLRKWMENRSFTDDNSRSKFSKNDDALGTDGDSQPNKNGISQNPNINTNYDNTATSEDTTERCKMGVLSFFRQWIQNKTIADDDSRSKFVESDKLPTKGTITG